MPAEQDQKPHFELGGDDKQISTKAASPPAEPVREQERGGLRKQEGKFGASINLVALGREHEKKK